MEQLTGTEPARLAVRSFYDAQKLRIEMGNRISAQRRDGVLSEDWEVRLSRHDMAMRAIEKGLLKDVRDVCKGVDIYEWLESVKGVGPAMAGVIISEMRDPARFENVSKLWAYTGLHVIGGRAAKRTKGEKANWNSFFKAKMVGVLGSSFLRSSSPYRDYYDNYKTRCESRPCSLPLEKHGKGGEFLPNGCTKGHIHNKAIRYMVKQFLSDLLVEWRRMRGLETRSPYAEEYLNRTHHG